MRYTATTSLLALLLGTTAYAQQWPAELKSAGDALNSNNPTARYSAREDLAREIERLPDPVRAKSISSIIDALPEQQYRTQLGTAVALARLRLPWSADDHEQQVRKLYDLFLKTKDDVLKSSIDDALANAKGYYRDAIHDYNQNRISDIDLVLAKFQRTPETLSKSRYVPNSIFYSAQYLTRAYLLGHDKGAALVQDANAILERFIAEGEKSSFREDARYFLAINHLLLKQKEAAIKVLRGIEAKADEEDRVYIYQFLYSGRPGLVIDRTYPPQQLALVTRAFAEQAGFISPDNQDSLVERVKNLK